MKPVFTLTADERAAVRAEMRAAMVETARVHQTITYSELALRLQTAYLHPHSFLFTQLLREIGREEVEAGRCILPAVVVSKATGMPGGGYFPYAAQMGGDPADLERMWRDDLEALYAYWDAHEG